MLSSFLLKFSFNAVCDGVVEALSGREEMSLGAIEISSKVDAIFGGFALSLKATKTVLLSSPSPRSKET